mgnify:CR=1 FL=1|jgi:hypothetical protein
MFDIMQFFRSIYVYITSKIKYTNLNEEISRDNNLDQEEEEEELFVSNIHL